MTDQPEETSEPAERTCTSCGGPYDQAPADAYIPVCVACQRKASRNSPIDADRTPG